GRHPTQRSAWKGNVCDRRGLRDDFTPYLRWKAPALAEQPICSARLRARTGVDPPDAGAKVFGYGPSRERRDVDAEDDGAGAIRLDVGRVAVVAQCLPLRLCAGQDDINPAERLVWPGGDRCHCRIYPVAERTFRRWRSCSSMTASASTRTMSVIS